MPLPAELTVCGNTLRLLRVLPRPAWKGTAEGLLFVVVQFESDAERYGAIWWDTSGNQELASAVGDTPEEAAAALTELMLQAHDRIVGELAESEL